MDAGSVKSTSARPALRWYVGLGTLLILFLLAGFLLARARAPRMFQHAERIVAWNSSLNPIIPPTMQIYGTVMDHHWLPDGSLLRVPGALAGPSVINTLEQVDAKTGTVTASRRISLRSFQRSTLVDPPLSPDGKLLFLEDMGDFALVDTQSGAVRILRRGEFGKDHLEIVTRMQSSDVMTEEALRPGARSKQIQTASYMQLANRVAWMPDSRQFLGDALLIDNEGWYVKTWHRIDLKTGQVTSGAFKISPQFMLVKQLEMSPDGKRILIKTVNVDTNLVEGLDLMMKQLSHQPLRFQVSIRVSDPDGSHMREVAGEKMSSAEEDRFQNVHWQPDSRHISFWYDNALYRLDADGK